MNNPYNTTPILKGMGLVGIDDVADRELQARDRRNAEMDKQIEDLLSEYTADPETIRQTIFELLDAGKISDEHAKEMYNIENLRPLIIAELRSMAERHVEDNQ